MIKTLEKDMADITEPGFRTQVCVCAAIQTLYYEQKAAQK